MEDKSSDGTNPEKSGRRRSKGKPFGDSNNDDGDDDNGENSNGRTEQPAFVANLACSGFFAVKDNAHARDGGDCDGAGKNFVVIDPNDDDDGPDKAACGREPR